MPCLWYRFSLGDIKSILRIYYSRPTRKYLFSPRKRKKQTILVKNTYTIVPLQPDGALRAHAGVSAGEEVCGRRADCGLPVPLQHAHLPQGGAEGAGALGTRFFHYVGIV